MSIASLNRFTVPTQDPLADSLQGLLMPKLKYRFRVLFTGFGTAGESPTVLTKQVSKVNRPQVTFDDMKLAVYNSTVKLPGKYSWGDTQVVLRDDATGQVSSLVGRQIQRQFDFYEQSSAASAGDFKFTMRVEILDGGNGADQVNVLERFDFLGCYIKQAKYDDLDYSQGTEPVLITLDIVYDNALQYRDGELLQGIGATLEPHLITTNSAVAAG